MCASVHNLTQYIFTRLLRVYSSRFNKHGISFHQFSSLTLSLTHAFCLLKIVKRYLCLWWIFVLLLWSESWVFLYKHKPCNIYTSDIFASKYWDEYAFFVYFEKNNFVVFSAVFDLLINKNYHISVKFRNLKAIIESSKGKKIK